MSSSYQVQQLLEKTKNGDPDVRWMACSDIQARAQEPNFTLDDATETQLVDQILSLFSDNNSEVKSQAARAISILVGKVKEARVQTIIEKLTLMTGNKDETLRDIASLGLRSVIKEIAPESSLAQTACNKLSPKVLQQLKNTDSPQDLLIQLIEVLGDIYSRFESTLRANPAAQSEGLAGLTPLLNDARGAVRKRTIRTLGNLIACSGDKVLSNLIDNEILPSLEKSATEQVKTTITLCSTLTASAPRRMGKKLSKVVPAVLSATQSEDEELKEIALQALETFLLKCSAEMNAHVTATVDAAASLVKYDPNYAGGDDEDMDADSDAVNGSSENGDDDADDDFEEEYEDDDDVSWKVRRSAVKVLEAAIETRLDLLASFYKTIAPVLISRFSEREESVKLEIWNTYTAQLRQTGIWAGSSHSPNGLSNGLSHLALASEDGRSSRAASPATLKRKRDENAADESPVSALSSQAQNVAKAVIKQLAQAKSVPVRQAGFALLTQMITVLHGGLDINAGNLVSAIETIMKSGGTAGSHMAAGNTSTTLKIQIFSFLSLFFKTHSLRVVQPHAKQLVKIITSALKDDVPKVGAAALSATSGLVVLLCSSPSGSGSPTPASSSGLVKELFSATVSSLSSNSVDQDVRERGILCLGDLVVYAGQDVGDDLPKALSILKDRLRNEITRLISLLTITKIADSISAASADKASASNPVTQLLLDTTDDVIAFLRKNNNPVQTASFHCLDSVIKKTGQLLRDDTATNMLAAIQQTLASPESHTARALSLVAALLDARPQLLPQVQSQILPHVNEVIASGSVASGQPLEALLRFMSASAKAGSDPKKTIDALARIIMPKQAGLQTAVVVSRCIGVIHRSTASRNKTAADKIVKDVASAITASKQQTSHLSLNLLTIGEIGRKNDLRAHQNAFLAAVGNLTNANEEIRSAAAFAVGNMAAGSPSAFLPAILSEIQQASKDDRKLHLLLGAVKETLSHSSADALSGLSEALWQPLFQICEAASDQQKAAADSAAGGNSARVGDDARLDGTRNIAAECLGKITLSNPSVYLPQLQSRLQAKSPGTRAAVITAIRFTFTDSTSTYDDLLAPIIVQFLSLMKDADLNVRRLAVSSLTSAVHNKPQIIRDHMTTLQPLLYQETVINPDLIHEVKMGPFTVKVDDGLSIRKATYQCMYTLLETCFTKLDMKAYLDIVVNGLSDDDDIKVSSFLMLVKLRNMAPTAVVQRLDAAATPFDAILKTKTKETSVKQEIEKLAEMQRSALRTMATLARIANAANSPKFVQLIQDTKSSALWGSEFKTMITAAEEVTAGPALEAQTMDLD